MFKINDSYPRNTLIGENDIYRKFSIEFDSLFNPDEIAKTDCEFDNIYVNDSNFEKSLENFLNSRVSSAKFCVGYTGIGKTTSIRYCFNIKTSNAPTINVDKKMIVFPTFLDGYRLEEMRRFDLSKRISSVCTALEIRHPELKEKLRTFNGKKEFYEFMLRHNAFALENIDPIMAMDLSEEELIIYSLKKAFEEDQFIYQANRLKFYLYKKRMHYNRFVILLDDIETLPQEYQREIIKKYLKLFDCMKNTDYEEDSSYNVNLLISMRPHTHRYLRGDRDIEAYPLGNPILKKEAVDLSELFKKRFDFYSKKYRAKDSIGNVDSWLYCYNSIISLNNAFDGKYKKMIQRLCFFNIRESLAAYARVFANRFWIQKNMAKSEAFTISPKDYVFNNINVIRALACNEELVYFGTDESLIPNFFYTSPQEDYTIVCLLIMKYFIRKRNGEDYGINAQGLKSIEEELNDIFVKDYTQQFIKVINYLFNCKVLRKSIYEEDDFKTLEVLEDDSRLYISPRGDEMFEMLSRDSVLMEMLRESAWRCYDNREYSPYPSIELTKNKDHATIYIDLLDYIDYLCEKEDDIYTKGIKDNKQQNYFLAFGRSAVVVELIKGVKKSISYAEDICANRDIKEKIVKTEIKIAALQKRIESFD